MGGCRVGAEEKLAEACCDAAIGQDLLGVFLAEEVSGVESQANGFVGLVLGDLRIVLVSGGAGQGRRGRTQRVE